MVAINPAVEIKKRFIDQTIKKTIKTKMVGLEH